MQPRLSHFTKEASRLAMRPQSGPALTPLSVLNTLTPGGKRDSFSLLPSGERKTMSFQILLLLQILLMCVIGLRRLQHTPALFIIQAARDGCFGVCHILPRPVYIAACHRLERHE